MKRIGNNQFFQTTRGAKTAASRRNYPVGSRIVETDAGFCLLTLGEGADSQSYRIISRGGICSELTDRGWCDEEFLRDIA